MEDGGMDYSEMVKVRDVVMYVVVIEENCCLNSR